MPNLHREEDLIPIIIHDKRCQPTPFVVFFGTIMYPWSFKYLKDDGCTKHYFTTENAAVAFINLWWEMKLNLGGPVLTIHKGVD